MKAGAQFVWRKPPHCIICWPDSNCIARIHAHGCYSVLAFNLNSNAARISTITKFVIVAMLKDDSTSAAGGDNASSRQQLVDPVDRDDLGMRPSTLARI